MSMRILFVFCFVILAHSAFAGPLRLGSGLQDGMVVQQDKPMTVWGFAEPGAQVAILPDWASGAVTVTADASGYFSGIVAVPSVHPGDYRPHTLTVTSGDSQVRLQDILIGEVWLCSGQSNMQFGLHEVLDSTAEVAAAHHPHLRLLDVGLNFSATPCDSFRGRWMECEPATAARFSAVGYFFGERLPEALDCPVGIVFSGIGASAAQAYVPRDVLAAIDGAGRWHISFWDAMILVAAIRAGAETVWSEDLNDSQAYDGIIVRNPFSSLDGS